jgi:hypothetical protein
MEPEDRNSDWLELYEESRRITKTNRSVAKRRRFFHTTQLVRLVQGLPGAVLEAGCFRGQSSFLICSQLRQLNPKFTGHDYFIIDSFKGLSRPRPIDGQSSVKTFKRHGFRNTSEEFVREALKDFPDIEIFAGWIPEILQKIPEQQYRFVHIDVDLFLPTYTCLQYFYPRMHAGGIIVIDDYGPWASDLWVGCKKAVEKFSVEHKAPFAPLTTGNAFFIKR